jgi:DNA-binding LytR/AlgR family response regulator
MKVLILEDETLASEKVENLLKEIDASLEVVGILKSVEAAKEWFADNASPDLVISDIRLLDGLSFELFESISYRNPVIFTTAYDQYAIKAFEVNSIDYLLKPIQKDKMISALSKLDKDANSTTEPAPYQDIMEMIRTSKEDYKTRFMIKAGQKILAVPVDKIAYFYSLNKLTYIVALDGKKYPYDQTLEVIEHQVDPKLFFRANRKFIVKFESIGEIHPYFKGRIKINLTPEADDDIVISAERTPAFKKWLDM